MPDSAVASPSTQLRIVIPKGRIQEKPLEILGKCGVRITVNERSYRPRCSDSGISVKMMKPRNIPQLLDLGRHDCGFTGHDWVTDTNSKVVEVLDLGFDPVRLVAAVPEDFQIVRDPAKPLVVATEYETIARNYLTKEQIPHVVIRTYGATEVFPPEDADMIVDNTSSGETLRANHLRIVATLLESSTRFVASQAAMKDALKRKRIEDLATLMKSVLAARKKVLLEMNVPKEKFETVVRNLPCMRSPTVSPLFGEEGYAVKVAVDRDAAPALLVQLKALGAMDILEYELGKLLP